MASDKSHNLQEIFLNSVRKDHTAVTVFLVNGVKLQALSPGLTISACS